MLEERFQFSSTAPTNNFRRRFHKIKVLVVKPLKQLGGTFHLSSANP